MSGEQPGEAALQWRFESTRPQLLAECHCLCDDQPLGRQNKNETRDNRKMRLKTPATIEFRDLTGLVKKLKVALAACAVFILVSGCTSWWQLQMLPQIHSDTGNAQELGAGNDPRVLTVTLLYLLTFNVTAILFLRWTYLVKKNVLTLTSSKQAVSPGWSVGYYFIPFLTFWKPYQGLREAFEGSHPDTQYTWNEPSRPGLMPLWWGLWLASCTLDNVSVRVTDPHTAAWINVAGCLIKLPLIAVVWILISMMLDWQTAKSKISGNPQLTELPAAVNGP